TLDEARALVAADPKTGNQIGALMEVAQAYTPLDASQSFAIMQVLMARINEVVAAAAALDGLENQYLRNGEWMTPGSTGLSGLVERYSQSLASLANTDFDRSRTLSDQFERPELRFMTQLHMAQVLSDGQQRRGYMFRGGGRHVVFGGGIQVF